MFVNLSLVYVADEPLHVKLPEVIVEYPLGHKNRRSEGIPILIKKFSEDYKLISFFISYLKKIIELADKLDYMISIIDSEEIDNDKLEVEIKNLQKEINDKQ